MNIAQVCLKMATVNQADIEKVQQPITRTCLACGQPKSCYLGDGSSIHLFHQAGEVRYYYGSKKYSRLMQQRTSPIQRSGTGGLEAEGGVEKEAPEARSHKPTRTRHLPWGYREMHILSGENVVPVPDAGDDRRDDLESSSSLHVMGLKNRWTEEKGK
ncbi:hypothetical protein N1851_028180 [Merluccius polli]|uniref:Uncharacterized protein n=1 Tax=Merluccius polli TaxID=89951 RepID=A0AA47M972_MERPO|nr:hypothetical protein N1851_028180 [Merluccius polli]